MLILIDANIDANEVMIRYAYTCKIFCIAVVARTQCREDLKDWFVFYVVLINWWACIYVLNKAYFSNLLFIPC